MARMETGTDGCLDADKPDRCRRWQRARPDFTIEDIEALMMLGPPRPGWPEDFRVPMFPRMQGIA